MRAISIIKSRADDTHTRLENLYGALETLNAIAFFAKSPNLVNDIGRVIEAKMHGLYLTLSSLPVEEVPGEQVIETLIAQASDLQPMNTRVEAVQNKIGNYIEENEVYIRTLLKAEEKKTNSKIRLVEEQAPKPVSQGRPSPVSAKGKPKVRPKQVKGKASRG